MYISDGIMSKWIWAVLYHYNECLTDLCLHDGLQLVYVEDYLFCLLCRLLFFKTILCPLLICVALRWSWIYLMSVFFWKCHYCPGLFVLKSSSFLECRFLTLNIWFLWYCDEILWWYASTGWYCLHFVSYFSFLVFC